MKHIKYNTYSYTKKELKERLELLGEIERIEINEDEVLIDTKEEKK